MRPAILFLIAASLTTGVGAQQNANVESRVDAMLKKLTIEQKIDLLGGVDRFYLRGVPEIGLRPLKMSDGPIGVRTWGAAPAYAAGIGLAASWDTDLSKRIGVALGRDSRARGVAFLLAPGVNIYRAPMNGRNFEYFGEDPFLAARIVVPYIQGVQSQGVIATVKHFAANNSEYDRHNSNSVVDGRTLREIYFPAFEAAVKEARVGSVMNSYNLINGEHASQNAFLNVQVLKKEWGFRGILMSDWTSVYDGIAAANAGLDLEMPSGAFMNRTTLLPAIQQGKVSVATIDDKVRRILRTALEFNLVERDPTDLSIPMDDAQSRAVALESAEKAAVLLKNDGGLLPLDRTKLRTVAVIGPDAWPAVPTAGGAASVSPFAPVSIMTGLRDALPNTKVLYNRGVKDLHLIAGRGSAAVPPFYTDEKGTTAGLVQEEFNSGDFTAQPSRTVTVQYVDGWGLDEGTPSLRAKIGIRWSGYYIPRKSGTQRFIAAATRRDGYRLYVNGKVAIDQPSQEGQFARSYEMEAPAGTPIAVRMEYLPQAEKVAISFGALAKADMLDPDAAAIAKTADVVVLCPGFDPLTESERHDRTFALPIGQDEMMEAILAANPKTVVVLTAGGSVDASRWIDRTPVLLQNWYGGQEAGRAVARMLLGEVNPGGKLPMSWERRIEDNPTAANYYAVPGARDVKYNEGIFVGYRHFDQSQTKPLFPFGFGLSYTTFAFSNLSVSPAAAAAGTPVTVSFNVRNTGRRAGAEVAQVYVGDPSATVKRPVKELKGFARVELKPGESRRVSVTLDRRAFAYWDETSKNWKVDPGKFVIYAGNSSANVPLQGELTLK